MNLDIPVCKIASFPASFEQPYVTSPSLFQTLIPSSSSLNLIKIKLAVPAKAAAKQFKAELASINYEP